MTSKGAYTSAEVCEGAGLTYRQLDFLVRTGGIFVEVPVYGPGYARRFSEADMIVAKAAGALRRLGARSEVLRAVSCFLRAQEPGVEAGLLAVSADGICHWSHQSCLMVPAGGAYWVIDLRGSAEEATEGDVEAEAAV